MSILTIAWSMCAAVSAMLGIMHLLLWLKDHSKCSYLLSALMALGATGSAITELLLFNTTSVNTYQTLLQWEVLFVYTLLMPMIWLVALELDASQRILASVIVAMWSTALIINFVSPGSLVFTHVEEIKRQTTFWGESFRVGMGPANPWNLLANIAVVLILIYVVGASIKAWRRSEHRQAIVIGGSIVIFLLFGGVHSMLVDNGIIATPYMVSFAYLAIVIAMSYEMVSQAIQVPVLTREVAARQKRWQDLLDNVQLAVIAVDKDGIITYVNPFLQKLSGYPENELMHKSVAKLIPASEQEKLKSRLLHAIEAGPPPHSNWRIINASGKEHHLAWSTVRQFNPDGNITGLISVGVDITDQLKAQNALRHTQQEMERMMRVNLLGELASSLAHELNQPLAAILSNAQAARRMQANNKLEPKVLDEILGDIVRDNKRAREVIHGLRAFLRLGQIKRENITIDAIVAEVLRIVQSEINAQHIQLELDITSDSPLIYGNKIEIQQVLLNLIVNAIRIQHENPEDQRFIDIRATPHGNMMQFEVRDNGPGINAEDIDKIFKPFFTTSHEGLGMGLALSRRIVEAHGGRIWAENNPENGAILKFLIPLVSK